MSWHEGERATVVGGIVFMVLCWMIYFVIILSTWNIVTTLRQGNNYHIARRFFYILGSLKPWLFPVMTPYAYNIKELFDAEIKYLGTNHTYQVGWYYPPIFLLLVLPFGLMPYLPAFLLWLAVTFLLYMTVLSRIAKHSIMLPLCASFPAMFKNIYIGQNGFLSGTLMGGGLLLLDGHLL